MKAAVAEIEQAEGAIGVLINNAGLAERRRRERPDGQGAQAVRDERLRPGPDDSASAAEDRADGSARIVNISSTRREARLPGGGFYHATKYRGRGDLRRPAL